MKFRRLKCNVLGEVRWFGMHIVRIDRTVSSAAGQGTTYEKNQKRGDGVVIYEKYRQLLTSLFTMQYMTNFVKLDPALILEKVFNVPCGIGVVVFLR
jgi:hypothetical protein